MAAIQDIQNLIARAAAYSSGSAKGSSARGSISRDEQSGSG
jgi:hypothetical protein